MSKKLNTYVNSQYVAAANVLRSRKERRRVVAYVESYDDVYFWRTVLGSHETDSLYFEVMLPSKNTLTRGKKSVLSCLDASQLGGSLIACVDADYDYLLQGATEQSRRMLRSPWVLHTYVYAIENYQCYGPSLHDVCVSVTLNDHRIFPLAEFLERYSEACFPLFVWSLMMHKKGLHNKFSISDFNRVCTTGHVALNDPDATITKLKRKIQTKVSELQRLYPGNKADYLSMKQQLLSLGVTPSTAYLYMQGHHLFDVIVAPLLSTVCNALRQERQNEINRARAHSSQKRNEMSCYENSLQDVKAMLKKNTGFTASPEYRKLQADVVKLLLQLPESTSTSDQDPSARQPQG